MVRECIRVAGVSGVNPFGSTEGAFKRAGKVGGISEAVCEDRAWDDKDKTKRRQSRLLYLFFMG